MWSLDAGTELDPGTRWKPIATDDLGQITALNASGALWTGTERLALTPADAGIDWVGVIGGGVSGIRADGSIWLGGARAGADTDWLTGASGGGSTFAIKRDGSLWSLDSTSTWTRVGSAVGWTAVAPADQHTLGLRGDGSMWVWGEDNYGQLGDGLPAQAVRFAP